jgi:RNA polymerase sigma-70 factor (ECF subfamily)
LGEATDKLLRLLDDHGGRLHALLAKLTLSEDAAEDLLQDLFLRLSNSNGLLRATSPERYLFRTAINSAFAWRKRNQRARAMGELSDGDTTQWEQPIDKAVRREEIERVLAAMDGLSETSRELLTLRYLEGLSYDQMADSLGSTPHRVRALCSKAIARLRKRMGVGRGDE